MGEGRNVSKKEAAERQIHAAIKLTYEDEYECAITLAHAAEGMLVGGEEPHFFELLTARLPKDIPSQKRWVSMLNETAHWLKHTTPTLNNERRVSEYQAWVMVARAISKYFFTFNEQTPLMTEFSEKWWGSKAFGE